MVEQTRQPSRVVTLQAGPGDVDAAGALFDVNLRVSDRSARAVARQLTAIGDQLDREWASRRANWLPAPLHMLRPARALTRTIYGDIHSQLWGSQGLCAAVKAWMVNTGPGQGGFTAEAWTAWVSSSTPLSCAGWSKGVVVTVALVAALTALWMEWKA